jgi:hypothetical protein
MKTAMQELKDKIQHAIEELNSELSEYQAGYKQCLINIQNDIDFQMLQMEKEQIINSREDGFLWGMRNTNNFYADKVIESEQYYNETYESKTNL